MWNEDAINDSGNDGTIWVHQNTVDEIRMKEKPLQLKNENSMEEMQTELGLAWIFEDSILR